MRIVRFAALLLLALPARGWPDALDFTFGAGAEMPLALFGLADSGMFSWGESATVTADYRLPIVPLVFLEGIVGMDRLHVRTVPGYSVSVGAVGGGAGISLPLSNRLRVIAAADAGGLAAIYDDLWSASWFVAVDASLVFFINPSFGISAGASYKVMGGLFAGASVFLGVTRRVEIQPVPREAARTNPAG